jgi:flavin reductase (DIM6/NTAB) family NADH-FMN oxidoreductase RutF
MYEPASKKVALGPQTLIYPMPAFLIGVRVDGQPNFMVAAWAGIANSEPPMVSVAIRHQRYTYRGVKQSGMFSVNVPSIAMARETDYCGIESGAREDKAAACGFTLFYGTLEGLPLIQECPVNLECAVVRELDLGSHVLFIGEVKETHVSEECLSDGRPDVGKINPLVFATGARQEYYALGEVVARAFRVGIEIKKSRAT